jgi:hypothetical protein
MRHASRIVVRAFAVCALVCAASSVSLAGTIIKLDLGGVGPDVGMNGAGVLSTIDDGHPGTTGDQNTSIVYTGFLSPLPNVTIPPGPPASFSLTGLQAVPPTTVVAPLVIQNFVGGSFSLYDPANNLLLQGPLTNSALTGVMGPPGTGALFTTTLGAISPASLLFPFIAPGTVSLSMNMTNVNGGAGFSVIPPVSGGILQPFLADAAVNISADPSGIGPGIPEPASLTLVLLGVVAVVCGRRRVR